MGQNTCPRCTDEGIAEQRPIHARGYCRSHYTAMRKSGELDAKYTARGAQALCSAPDCTESVKARGLCNSHYMRLRRGADVDDPIRAPWAGECRFEGCQRTTDRDGLCAGHYSQQLRGTPLRQLRTYKPRGGACAVDHCTLPVRADGYCNRHYQRRLDGAPAWDAPIRPKAPDGTGWVTRQGYKMVYVEGRARGEHLLFAERVLARSLTPGENVHHVNGNRSDNRTDGPFVVDERGRMRSGNLEVWSTAQPPGQEIGPKIDWALDLLDLYRDILTPEQAGRLIGVSPRR